MADINYRRARTRGERLVLIITILFVVGFTMAVTVQNYTTSNLINFGLITLVVILASLFLIRLFQRQFLGNALKVEQGHFSKLKLAAAKVAGELKTAEPQVFVIQNPTLNAFALGFKKPYTITLHSGIVESLDDQEIAAIITHELGHIYFGHTKIQAYFRPIGSSLPGISYIFGFWSRRAEISADRLALMVTKDTRAVIDALIKTYVGPHFLAQLDAEGVLFQEHQTVGFLNKLAQSLGDHPYMTTRVKELLRFARQMGLNYIDKEGRTVCINCGLKLPSGVPSCSRCGMLLHKPTDSQ